MTLAKGDQLLKLDPTTKEPLKSSDESYIQWEVLELSQMQYTQEDGLRQFVFLKKVY